MNTPTYGRSRHYWVDTPGRNQRAAIIAGLATPPLLLPVTSAHRRLRGPYTAAGTIVRGLAARAMEQFPALVSAHEIEILRVAPELREQIPVTHETLTSLAVPKERTRFYSRLRTLRIAHGLTEFLRDYVARIGGPRSLVVDHMDSADQTDQEFISVLLRRLDPALLTVVVGTGGAERQRRTPAEPLVEPLAEELYDEARAIDTSASVHMQAAYATAMLYTRHHDQERRDHRRALGWINEAIAIAALLPGVKERAFNTVFSQNGLALIKNHLGERDEALRLVGEGLERLDRELDPDEHALHRSVLRYNRAQVYAGMGRLEEALTDFTAVIEEDPLYAEYHFDRAGLLRRLGRDDEAMAEYETAMSLSPPFPELYYNRADLRSAQGDLDGALADFGYVLELDPDYVDAYVNRAGILAGEGLLAEARRDVAAGLAVAPGDPHLLCLLGRLELEEGHHDAARAAAGAAVRADVPVAEAWARRAAVAFETGDPGAALADLTRAIELAADPALLFNRGSVHQAMENWAPAEADFTSAQLADLLHRLNAETQRAVTGIRRIVYGLRPPALDELGLAGALREEVTRLERQAPGLPITLHLPAQGLVGLPAAVEVAAYRIITEAVTNVRRHAGAHYCQVRIRAGPDLELKVCASRPTLPPRQRSSRN